MAASPLESGSIASNPLLAIAYEPAFEGLGEDYYDLVAAAEFPMQVLRFRNDAVLRQMGLEPPQVSDEDFVLAFGQFYGRQPLLAMRYHGYQFGEYNAALGDGRGFLYGQVRGVDGELYDLGTKGSGRTPYSRGGDGRLTLKGGVREVLAAEMLHRLGVRTSRCLSLIETGEALWRGDEPSPTRSSVMVRFSRSHIRFGMFERFHYLGRKDLAQKLLDHVIFYYYPHLFVGENASLESIDRYTKFYAELVRRVADLAAQWMSVGFCHAVLNTDNMSITGESFDYGPYAFINQYDPRFTAAYFDYYGRYAYANQPEACIWNLQMLQVALKQIIPEAEMELALTDYYPHFQMIYLQRMTRKLGFEVEFDTVSESVATALLRLTLQLLLETKVGYHDFFMALRQQFSPSWREDVNQIPDIFVNRSTDDTTNQSANQAMNQAMNSGEHEISDRQNNLLEQWRQLYHQILNSLPQDAMPSIAHRLSQHNPTTVIVRPEIEAVWAAIDMSDDWQPFNQLLDRIRGAVVD